MKKILLSITSVIISNLILGQTVPTYVPSNGLVAWWPFSGNANDESGNGNNGVNNGSILSADRLSNPSNSYYFNGTSSNISINNSASLALTTNFSISMWVYLYLDGTSSDGHHLIVKGDNSTNEYSIVVNKSTRKFGLNKQGAQTYVLSNSALPLQTWTHIVATLAYPTAKLYINGVLDASGTATSPIATINSMLRIGSILPTGTNTTTKGNIDDIGLWNRALTSTEVSNLFQGNSTILAEFKAKEVSIFPNPATKELKLTSSEQLIGKKYTLIDGLGKIKLSGKVLSSEMSVQIEDVDSGLYHFQIEGQQTVKIIIINN